MAISAVIGDDMTGCMDAGIQLVKKGYRVNVAINNEDIQFLASQSDVVVVDTESRNITSKNAYSKVHECIKSIGNAGYSLKYKKVDSTLRGNIGSELEAVLLDHKIDLIVFAPALPYHRRTIMNGIHYLNSLELTESDIAKDPFSPIKSSYIPEIISYQTDIKTLVLNLSEVRRGARDLAAKFDDSCRKGFQIAVVDAEVEEDLVNIAIALKNCEVNALACGSAGLLAYMMEKKDREQGWINEIHNKNNRPILVISGSPAKATKLQLESVRNCGIKVLKLDTTKYRQQDSGWLNEVEKIKKDAIKVLSCGEDIVIDGAGEGKEQIYEKYKNHPDSLWDISKTIQNTLSDIFNYLNKELNIGGAVVVGGDTVFNICNGLSVKGLKINGEADPLIPCGLAIGGKIDGMPIVTKAGGFGSQDAILKSIKYLKGEMYHEK